MALIFINDICIDISQLCDFSNTFDAIYNNPRDNSNERYQLSPLINGSVITSVIDRVKTNADTFRPMPYAELFGVKFLLDWLDLKEEYHHYYTKVEGAIKTLIDPILLACDAVGTYRDGVTFNRYGETGRHAVTAAKLIYDRDLTINDSVVAIDFQSYDLGNYGDYCELVTVLNEYWQKNSDLKHCFNVITARYKWLTRDLIFQISAHPEYARFRFAFEFVCGEEICSQDICSMLLNPRNTDVQKLLLTKKMLYFGSFRK